MLGIKEIFSQAVKRHASDVHFAVGFPLILRIDGELVELKTEALTGEDVAKLGLGLLNDRQRKQFEEEKELDFAYELPEISRFRVNLHLEKGRVGMVARLVSTRVPTMEEVAMPEIVYELLDEQQGMILVTGPSGRGKSTSLAAMIDHINTKRRVHIITLEDPIEFIYTPKKSVIKQRQLGDDMISFHEALRHALRQDPNVLLVGEMRDLETIATAITIAETGHLVLATLHTMNAAQTVDRIIDVFPPYQQHQVRLQISLFLKAIISQQLLPKKGGGRIASREILINTPAIANLIRENKIEQIKTVIQTSGDVGMISMDQAIKQLVMNGQIEKEIGRAYMTNPATLR